jgi:hypothetical protein
VAAVVGVEVAVLVLGAVALPAVVHSLAGYEGGEGEGGGEGEEEGAGGWFQFFQFFLKARGLRGVRWWIGVKIGVGRVFDF